MSEIEESYLSKVTLLVNKTQPFKSSFFEEIFNFVRQQFSEAHNNFKENFLPMIGESLGRNEQMLDENQGKLKKINSIIDDLESQIDQATSRLK